MCALWLVNQLWVIVPVNPRKNRAFSELLYYTIILLYYYIILEEFVNHSPAVRGLRILLVFYQHPAWFINLQPIETCGVLLK